MAERIKLTVNVVVDMSPLLNVKRYSDKNKPTLLNTAANRYLQYLRNRFIRLASGRGEWPPLTEQTIIDKEYRGIADNPEWIMRESDFLLAGLRIAVRGGKTIVGYTHELAHPRAPGVLFLARVHSRGIPREGRLVVRKVVALPPKNTREKMVEDIRKQYNIIIRRNRKK